MSRLTKISVLLAVFFALDKGVAILRQLAIARLFGLSKELDAFNVANNVPDMLFALISGGALAVAFIPVLTEILTQEGRPAAWKLFSNIANLAFVVTAVLAVLVAIFARFLVQWELGIAPGFQSEQQELVVTLMRLNLIATLIFSISGLVMAGLQANQHFLLPAIAPLLYNVGQIFGAVILSPEKGFSIAGITFPAYGMGVYGLVYGVIVGALLHLAIQIPGLIRYQFRWSWGFDLAANAVQKVLRLMGPRLLTMVFIQAIFLIRDNLASRLDTGAVSALTYGWMLMQVPETLIGTAIGTAMLPTLAELVAKKDLKGFSETIERAIQVLMALTLPVAAVLAFGLEPLIQLAFKFSPEGTALTMWVTRGFLLGLMGHSFMEVAVRSYYARQQPWLPALTAAINATMYVGLGLLFFKPLGAAGISLTDALAYTTQAVILVVFLSRRLPRPLSLQSVPLRALGAAAASGLVTWGMMQTPFAARQPVVFCLVAMALGGLIALPFIFKEVKLLLRL